MPRDLLHGRPARGARRSALRTAGLAMAAGVVLWPPAAGAEAPLNITARTVSVAPAEVALTLTGIIEATHSFGAGFPNGGQMISVAVEVGQTVAPGDLLAEMDPTQAREALHAAEAARRAAEASLLRAAQEVERDRQLSAQGYLAQAVLDQAEEALVNASAARDQAMAGLATAQKALDDTRLLASRAAVVTARNAEPGQVVAAAQSVVDLAEISGREAVFIAPADYDLDGLVGRQIRLAALEPPRRQFSATISHISPVVDSGTGGVAVKAVLGDADALGLMLREPVEASLPIPLGAGVMLPAPALTRGANGAAVWVVAGDGSVALRDVTVARYTTDAVYVSAGLADGEVVAVAGSDLLFPGRKVQIVKEPTEGGQP